MTIVYVVVKQRVH
jgi:hypothetical protein